MPASPSPGSPDPTSPADPSELIDEIKGLVDTDNPDGGPGDDLVVPLIGEKLVIRRRYEAMSIINDIIASLFFIAGSIVYFFDSLVVPARILFLCGSVLMLMRPLIRLRRRMYLTREDPHDTGDDASTWY